MNQIDIKAFFQQLTSYESLLFIAFCLGAFLFGLLVGYAMRSRKVRTLKKELKKKDQQIVSLEEQIQQHDEEIALKDADLKKAAYDLNQARLSADRFEQENSDLNKQVFLLRGQADKNQESGVSYGATFDELNDQILGLKTRNQELQQQVDQQSGVKESAQVKSLNQQIIYLKGRNEELQTQIDAASGDDPDANVARISALQQQVQYLKQENEALKAEHVERPVADPVGGGDAEATRMATIEARLAQLEAENGQLKNNLNQIEGRISSGEQLASRGMPTDRVENDFDEQEAPMNRGVGTDIFATDRALLRSQDRDDLSLIDGVGPFLEKKLNDIGIQSYEQIADWSAADIKNVTQQIQYFEGRIEKDNWVGQAKILKDTPANELPTKTATTKNVDVNEGDDLKVVEGIGPKIEVILKGAGILTLGDLAKSDPADLELMLTQADNHFQMHDPGTWPAQARLAANGDWEVLEDYQKQLKGGREDFED